MTMKLEQEDGFRAASGWKPEKERRFASAGVMTRRQHRDSSSARSTCAERLLIMRAASRHGGHSLALREAKWLLEDQPEHRLARRLAIQAALALNDVRTARHLLAVGLLLRPKDARLLALHAQFELEEGWIASARRSIADAIRRAPDPAHLPRSMRRVFAFVMAESNHVATAASILMPDLEHRTHDAQLRMTLADWLGRCGQAEEALRILAPVIRPPLLLQARLLSSAGRLTEAVDSYDRLLNTSDPISALHRDLMRAEPARARSISGDWSRRSPAMPSEPVTPMSSGEFATPAADAETDHHRVDPASDEDGLETLMEYLLVSAALERIDILERLGDRPRLLSMAHSELETPAIEPVLRLRLAESMLELGRPRLAFALALRDRRAAPNYRRRALAVLAVAATMLSRPGMAQRCVQRLEDEGDEALNDRENLGSDSHANVRTQRLIALARHDWHAGSGAGLSSTAPDHSATGTRPEPTNRSRITGTPGRRWLARAARRAILGRFIVAHSSGTPDRSGETDPSNEVEPATRHVPGAMIAAAVRALDQEIAARPGYPDLRFHRAALFSASDQSADAVSDLDAALMINPAYVAARRLRDRLRAA